MANEKACIAFTGGGTGGHVYPGIAVIEQLKKTWPGRIIWIGSGKEVERKPVEAMGIEFFSIPSGKLRRSFSLQNFIDAFKVLGGYFAALKILRKTKPVLLFSKGGYVSVPPCYAASHLRIPVLTHESDMSLGLATRLNAAKADRILVSWKKTMDLISPAYKYKTVVVGNPIRDEISKGSRAKGLQFLGFDGKLPIVLVLGGSQGALQVNELISSILPELKGKACVAHQTGPGNKACQERSSSYYGFEFIRQELYDVMAASDIIIGRAGAGTIWESSAAKKPMILIPLGGPGSRGDQVENAKLLEQNNAAICLAGEDANPEKLLSELNELLCNKARRERISEKASSLMPSNAAEEICELILKRAKEAR